MLATSLFVLVGVVNLLPVAGVFSASRLQTLYGVALEDPNLVILMRHRAVLFGIVGAIVVAGAFIPSFRPFSIAAGLVSMLSFVLVAHLVGESNTELRHVVIVDLVASALLAGAGLVSL
jgi:hypothetical protein